MSHIFSSVRSVTLTTSAYLRDPGKDEVQTIHRNNTSDFAILRWSEISDSYVDIAHSGTTDTTGTHVISYRLGTGLSTLRCAVTKILLLLRVRIGGDNPPVYQMSSLRGA